MRVSLDGLESHLQRPLARIYLVFGKEPLQIEEAADSIRRAARAAGVTERVRLAVEPRFDWGKLYAETQALSLFSRQRLIELRMPDGKPGSDGSKALSEYVDVAPADTHLLIIAGPIDKRAKWYSALEKAGVTVEAPAVRPEQLPGWVGSRLHGAGLGFDPDVVAQLCHLVEGNLLAASQEIEKLKLSATGETLSVADLEALADHTRYDVYAYANACLAGNSRRGIRILQRLRSAGVAPTLVVWALAQDTRILADLAAERVSGSAADAALKKRGVWGDRLRYMRKALARSRPPWWHAVVQRVALADQLAKGRARPGTTADIWTELERIGLAIGGVGLKAG